MKLCFSTLASPDWNLQQIIDHAVSSGVQGIDFRGIGAEIDITRLAEFNEPQLDITLARLRGAGLEMPCLNTSVTLVSPSADRWQSMLDECARYAQLAEKTNTRYLRIFGGKVPKEMTRDEARTMAQRHLRQLVKITRPSGCQVILETHDDWTTSDQVLELLHEISPEDAGVLWDMEHPYRRGEPLLDTAHRLKRFIRHAHIKDSVRGEKGYEPRLLGEGDLPLKESIQALRAIEYDGWLCLETEKRWYPELAPDPQISIPQFANFMRDLLRRA